MCEFAAVLPGHLEAGRARASNVDALKRFFVLSADGHKFGEKSGSVVHSLARFFLAVGTIKTTLRHKKKR